MVDGRWPSIDIEASIDGGLTGINIIVGVVGSQQILLCPVLMVIVHVDIGANIIAVIIVIMIVIMIVTVTVTVTVIVIMIVTRWWYVMHG